MGKPRVYLAGPISGCNDEQRHAWRNDLKKGFCDEFEFIDPTDKLIGDEGSDFEVVQADVDAIITADAVLANMWRESIGTSFGILHAHLSGKIVVVNDPNLIRSRMTAFYADSVERSIYASLAAIRTFLSFQNQIVAVRKQDGNKEPFDRRKLHGSIRAACKAAGESDIVPARAVVARAMAILMEGDPNRELSTSEIKDAVWTAIAELESDPLHDADYARIRAAWDAYDRLPGETAPPPEVTTTVQILEQPLPGRPFAPGGHSCIYGHINRIPAHAIKIFNEIRRVEGVIQIQLGQFSNNHSAPAKPHVRVQASKLSGIIDGKLYDKGDKGTLQDFQLRVADPKMRDAILAAMIQHLNSQGYIRSVVFSADQ